MYVRGLAWFWRTKCYTSKLCTPQALILEAKGYQLKTRIPLSRMSGRINWPLI